MSPSHREGVMGFFLTSGANLAMTVLLRSMWLVVFLVGASMSNIGTADDILMSAPGVEVSDKEVDLYLQYLTVSSRESREHSSVRVSQAIIELYALKVLDQRAKAAGILDQSDQVQWLSDYLVSSERVKLFIEENVESGVAAMDFEQAAAEHYQAHKPDYRTSPRVQVRTLLIRSDDRSLLDAIDLTRQLVSADMSAEQFQQVIVENTEDDSARRKKGVMTISRGQTVPPFEEAAFALQVPGEISDPVVSRFGVHSIQLIEKLPEEDIPFSKVKDRIIAQLKKDAAQQMRDAIVLGAREEEPEGFYIDEAAVHGYMRARGYEPKGVDLK